MIKKNSFLKYSAVITLCLLCALVGWYVRVWYINNQPSKLWELRENSSNYNYINPLLLVDVPKEAPEYNSLKKQISDYINTAENAGDITDTSIYFRDLNSGRWTGVNENDVYDPSSMLKVAVMVGYLDQADADPTILLKKFSYEAVVDPGQYYKPKLPLKSGIYTTWDLIQAMILDSDNTALNILYDNNRQYFIDVLKTLEIPPPASTTTLDFMSPKIYSRLFRTLFSATYLSKTISEQALKLMTYTTFKDGLVTGVPENIIISHKFGEHTTLDSLGKIDSKQLHDCGVVYYPRHPYLLCVMTKGQDFSKLQSVISNISNITYKNIDADNH